MSRLEQLREDGWRAPSGELLAALLREDLEARSSTDFDDAISFLTLDDLARLIAAAVAVLPEPGAGDTAAESVIEHTALQAPQLLTEHLDALWEARPNESSYTAMWPWRAADAAERAMLAEIEDPDGRAREALLETRCVDAIEPLEATDAELWSVGFTRAPGTLRRVASDRVYHLIWPAGDLTADAAERPSHLHPHHPTWRLPAAPHVATAVFGGMASELCDACTGRLHRLLEWSAPPPGLLLERPGRLELAVCLSCLGWESATLAYRHDEHGTAHPYPRETERIEPEFPADPPAERTVALVATPRRWVRQDWGVSNSRQNLNRVGGEFCWIQSPEYPDCPGCGNVMDALLQLDSEPPGSPWLWGSGGIGYVCWCDACAISTVFWQCT